MDNIVIEIDATIGPGLTRALDILVKMGKISKEDADAFSKMTQSSNQFSASQDKVQKELTETQGKLSQVGVQAQKTGTALNDTGKATGIKNVNKELSGLQSTLKGLAGTIASVFAVQQLVSFGKEAINLSAKFNSIQNALNFVQGSAEKGAEAMEFLRKLSEDLGLELVSTAEAFKLFSASAQLAGINADDTKEIFTNVAGATTALGLSAEDTNGVFLALSQIISKGTVQAEELRGQIGERLPGAFELAAKAMGVTTKELNKMLEQGQVLAKDFLPKFSNQLKETFSGGLETAAQGAQANLNRISNAFTQFKKSIGDILNTEITAFFQLFGDGQDELIQKSADLIRLNREQAISSQALLKEYDSLTKNGIVPNAEQKNRLKVITLQLKDALGESVVSINKETGALELNRKAAETAIKQKLLLANQEAGTLALKINNAKQDAAANKILAENFTQEIEIRKQILSSFNITTEQADRYYQTILKGGAAATALETQLGKERLKAIKDYEQSTRAYEKTSDKVRQQTELVEKLTVTLKDLGFSASDVENLFGDSSDKTVEDVKKIGDSLDQLRLKLASLQKEQGAIPDALGTGREAFNKKQKEIEEVQRQIDELTGRLRKQSSDKELSEREKSLKELHDLEKKASDENLKIKQEEVDKVVALEQEKQNQLADLVEKAGKASGANVEPILISFKQTGRVDLEKTIQLLKDAKFPTSEIEKFQQAVDDTTDSFSRLQEEIINTNRSASFKIQFEAQVDFNDEQASKAADDLEKKFANKKIGLILDFQQSGDTSTEAFEELQKKLKALDKQLNNELLQNKIDSIDRQIAAGNRANEQAERLGQKQVVDVKKLEKQKTDLIQEQLDERTDDYQQAAEDQHNIDLKRQKEQQALSQGLVDAAVQALSLAQQASDQYYQGQIDNIDRVLQAQLDAYEEQADANEELHDKNKRGDREYENTKKKIDKERKAAEDKADKERRKLLREQAIINRDLAIANAVINTAVGATAQFQAGPVVGAILAGLIIALGAVQIGLIASQPIPSFAKGTERVAGKGTETSDEVPARLSVGERVVKASTNRKYYPILSAIHHERIDAETLNTFTRFTKEELRLLAAAKPDFIQSLKVDIGEPMPKINFRRDMVSNIQKVIEREKVVIKEIQTQSNFNEYDVQRAVERALKNVGITIGNTKQIAQDIRDHGPNPYDKYR